MVAVAIVGETIDAGNRRDAGDGRDAGDERDAGDGRDGGEDRAGAGSGSASWKRFGKTRALLGFRTAIDRVSCSVSLS